MSVSIFCVNYFNNLCQFRRGSPRSPTEVGGHQSSTGADMPWASAPVDRPTILGSRGLSGGFVQSCRASIRVTTRDNQDDKFLMG